MKRTIIVLVGLLLFTSCNNKPTKKGNLIIKGQVKGLRLGNLIIKKIVKDSLIPIDSIKVDGNEKFKFISNIDQAQILLLQLPEIKDGRITFFASPNDTIQIFTFLESFGISPKIKGGNNQLKRNEYQQMIKKFNEKELDLFKEKFDATKLHQVAKADSLSNAINRFRRKRVLYALNFVFTNKNKAIAPYVAMMEFYNNPKALDTIYKILPKNLQQSIYGKEIKKLLK